MFNGTYQTFPAFLLAVISEVINGDNATDAPDAYDTSPNNPARFWSHNADGRSQAHTDLHAAWVGRVEADFDATHGTDQAASDTAAAAHVTMGAAAQGTVAQARQAATVAHRARRAKYLRDATKADKRVRRKIMAAIAKHTTKHVPLRCFDSMCTKHE